MYEIIMKYHWSAREVWSTLETIIRRGAEVKLDRNKLIVKLRRFKDEAVDYVARHLCEELNQLEPHTLDRFRFPIHYEVE